jgi:hypothetical protein
MSNSCQNRWKIWRFLIKMSRLKQIKHRNSLNIKMKHKIRTHQCPRIKLQVLIKTNYLVHINMKKIRNKEVPSFLSKTYPTQQDHTLRTKTQTTASNLIKVSHIHKGIRQSQLQILIRYKKNVLMRIVCTYHCLISHICSL